jgi:hypothetical protein
MVLLGITVSKIINNLQAEMFEIPLTETRACQDIFFGPAWIFFKACYPSGCEPML